MEAPAHVARRLLFALALALLFATSLSLIDGRLPPSECEDEQFECTSGGDIGWLLPISTALIFTLATLLHLGVERGVDSPLLRLFPADGESAQRDAIVAEMRESRDEDELSDAWAGLEAGLLSAKTSEEE